jgi:putative nucleotidyltransferase with HDIG domain
MRAVGNEVKHRANQDALRLRIREIKERHKLPSPPTVMSKVIHILKDPDFNVRDLSRVISDDPALASKTLSMSRSPRYAQRMQPQTVHQAILVLGLQTLRNIVVATAAKSFIARTNKISENIWSHSLAAALAGRIVAKRIGFGDPEQAFLAGLLHDVGEMVLFNSDPRSFEELIEETLKERASIVKKEAECYGFDHAAVGVALLDFWHIDEQVSDAVLNHHKGGENGAGSLAAIIDMSDYLCARADLGFFGEFPAATDEMLRACACADEVSLSALVQEVRDAFEEESLLFKEA